MSIFDEPIEEIEKDSFEVINEPIEELEEEQVTASIFDEPIEELTPIDQDETEILSNTEVVALEATYGIYEIANTWLGVESTTMDEVRESLDEHYEYSPDKVKNMVLATSKYAIDIWALSAAGTKFAATKVGAPLVKKAMKLLNSKNPKVAFAAAAALTEAEEALTATAHGEEYTPGTGAVIGGSIGVAYSKRGKLFEAKDALVLQSVKISKKFSKALSRAEAVEIRDTTKESLSAPMEKSTGSDKVPAVVEDDENIKTMSQDKAVPKQSFALSKVADENSKIFDDIKDIQVTVLEPEEMDFLGAGNIKNQDNIFVATPEDTDLMGLDGEHIFLTKEALKRKDLKSILEEEVGHILDERQGIGSKYSMDSYLQNKDAILLAGKNSGRDFSEENLQKLFAPTEIRQNKGRLQLFLDEEGGIQKVLDDETFKAYADIAYKSKTKTIEKLKDLYEVNALSPKSLSEVINNTFDSVGKTLKKEDSLTKIPYEDEEWDEFFAKQDKDSTLSDLESGSQIVEPIEKGHPDYQKVKDLEEDRKFFTQDIREIRKTYNKLNTEGKQEFVEKFIRLSDSTGSKERLETVLDDLNEATERLAKVEADINLRKRDVGITERADMDRATLAKQKKATNDLRGLNKERAMLKNKTIKLERERLDMLANEQKVINSIFSKPELFDFYRQEISDSITRKLKDITAGHKNRKMVKPRESDSPKKEKKEPEAKIEAKPKQEEPLEGKKKTEESKRQTEKRRASEQRIKEHSFSAKDYEKEVELDSVQKKIVDRFLKIIGEDVKVTWNKKLDKVWDEKKGEYVRHGGNFNRVTGEIELNPNIDSSKITKTFVHELAHAVSYHAIRKDESLYKELEEIIELSKKATGSDKYWSRNPDELISEYFSKTEVMEGLKDVEINRDIFYRLANLIRRALGLKKLPTTVGEKLEKIIDDIEKGIYPKASKEGREEFDRAVSKAADMAEVKVNRLMRDAGIFKVDKTGKVTIGSFETDYFKTILNDIGITNKKTTAAIKSLRAKVNGMKKHEAEISKSISSIIRNSSMKENDIKAMIQGRVATVLANNPLEKIKAITTKGIADKHRISESELKELISGFGQKNVGKENNFPNVDVLFNHLVSRFPRLDESFKKDFEILVAKDNFDFNKKIDKDVLNMLRDMEELEDIILGAKKQHGYIGFIGQHDFNLKVAKSKEEISKYSEDSNWKRVGKTNTFYQLNLDADVSDGILPSSTKPFQGTIISEDIEGNMKRLKEEKIPFSKVMDGSKVVQLRLYPSEQTKEALGYSEDLPKLMARKHRLLNEQAIRTSVMNNLSGEIKSLFAKEATSGFVKIDEDMAVHYRKIVGAKENEEVFVKKEFADLLVGVKESLLYKGDNRFGRMAERTYKDIFKRFKRSVTAKSPSSILNNLFVIPSMLKMNGANLTDIPKLIIQSNKDYTEYVEGMKKYYSIKIKLGDKAADRYLQSFRKKNIIAEMMEDGSIQSAVDDSLIQLNNEADMLQYFPDSLFGFKESKLDRIMNNIEMKPDSEIGRFFLNKFVMADILGRASMYAMLRRTKGMGRKEAAEITTGAFVDFSSPLPKPIRILEEYGVPFIGWMYKVQTPMYRAIKKNPTSAAEIVIGYYALQAMFDDNKDNMQDGYAGDLKIDSWFYHNSFADTGVLTMSPLANMEAPSIVPQLHKEVSGTISGDKNPLEIMGFNIKSW